MRAAADAMDGNERTTTRVQLEMPPQAMERLTKLKEKTEAASYAEVIRNALRLFEALVEELCQRSPEFASMWREHDVRSHGEGTKTIRHRTLGLLSFEYSAFAVDGRPDLSMVVYNPATPEDAARVRSLLIERDHGG